MKTAKQVIHRIKTIAANRHRAELDRLRIEAIVTHRMIAAIVAEQARLQKGNR